jgi:hypothetical protein
MITGAVLKGSPLIRVSPTVKSITLRSSGMTNMNKEILDRLEPFVHGLGKAILAELRETVEQSRTAEKAVLYVSKVQLEAHKNPDGPAHDDFGRYIPARKTPSGKFTTPLFTHPAEKLTEEQKNVMYDFATLSRGTPLEWFKAGIEASERQHKIGTL